MNAPHRDRVQCCEEAIRSAPLPSVGVAILAGILLRILPVGALLRALVRLALSLVRPALLVLGVVKVANLIQESSRPPEVVLEIVGP